jgi:hypothetical protein
MAMYRAGRERQSMPAAELSLKNLPMTNLSLTAKTGLKTAACTLLPTKPGTALHYITGFDERSCQRYAAGTVKPPAYFLRTLLRTDQGKQWLAAVMDGCDQQWWRDHQRAERIVASEDNIDRS